MEFINLSGLALMDALDAVHPFTKVGKDLKILTW